MKTISLHQPWASLCVIGAKTYETRSFATSYRGKILIHAAKKQIPKGVIIDEPFWTALGGKPWVHGAEKQPHGVHVGDIYKSLPLGCIVGQVEVVECYRIDPQGLRPVEWDTGDELPQAIALPTGPALAFGDFSVGRFAWELRNPIRFAEPIPFPGKQGFFNVDDEVVAEKLSKG